MDPYRLVEIRRFYRELVPRLRKDKAPLNSMERAAVEQLMGELIADAMTRTRTLKSRPREPSDSKEPDSPRGQYHAVRNQRGDVTHHVRGDTK